VCCLRPGIPGVSENITVRSIVDRFLEHTRVYYFANACQPEVFVGSADWLPRNLFRRIETVFPIADGLLRDRVISEILATPLADNTKARVLFADGSYHRAVRSDQDPVRRSQAEFMALATSDPKARGASPKSQARYPRVEIARPPHAPGTK
jgi:polyphosphate kinase